MPRGKQCKKTEGAWGEASPTPTPTGNSPTPPRTGNKMSNRGNSDSAGFPSKRTYFGETLEDKNMISNILHQICEAYVQPKVKSDEELEQRIQDYFQWCIDAGEFPTVEEMVLYTGYNSQQFNNWMSGRSPGFSSETAKIARRAIEVVKSFDARMVISGKMQAIPYIFRSKNFYDMSDKNEVTITPNMDNDNSLSAEEIAKKYMVEEKETIEATPDEVE